MFYNHVRQTLMHAVKEKGVARAGILNNITTGESPEFPLLGHIHTKEQHQHQHHDWHNSDFMIDILIADTMYNPFPKTSFCKLAPSSPHVVSQTMV